jgi:hypothetical protein
VYAEPGQELVLEVWVSDINDHLRSYAAQFSCGETFSVSGDMTHLYPQDVDIFHPFFVFSGFGLFGCWDAVFPDDLCPQTAPYVTCISGLVGPGPYVDDPRYLGEFRFSVSENAGGWLRIPLNDPLIILNDENAQHYPFTFDGAIVVVPIGCPEGEVEFLDPPGGVVDARQPHPIDNVVPSQGISMITVSAPAGAPNECWTLCETVSGETPNVIESMTEEGGIYTITLARPITPGGVTQLTYTDDYLVQSIGTFTAHPANVNSDGYSSPLDVLAIIDCLNGVDPTPGAPNENCPWGLYSSDIDHSGQFNPSDILREIDLLNGANAYDPWLAVPRPAGACTPTP